ncbi:hypothetical protein J3E68DRAFT_406753 [Trichoderma sp. SZMC 28012]
MCRHCSHSICGTTHTALLLHSSLDSLGLFFIQFVGTIPILSAELFYLRNHSYFPTSAIGPPTRLMVSSSYNFSKILSALNISFSCPVAFPIVIHASLGAVPYSIYVRPYLLQ